MKRICFIFLFLSQLGFGQVNLNLGLRAYYPFSGNANDVSGNNNNPVFNNATLTADRLGNPNSAYHFNGVYQYMRIPNKPSLNFGNTISLSVWVRPKGFYYGICHASQMIRKGGGNYNPGIYALRVVYTLYSACIGCDGIKCDSLTHKIR